MPDEEEDEAPETERGGMEATVGENRDEDEEKEEAREGVGSKRVDGGGGVERPNGTRGNFELLEAPSVAGPRARRRRGEEEENREGEQDRED